MEGGPLVTRLVRRNAETLLAETLSDTPITVIQGARQVGKSTLAAKLVSERGGVLVSLDDPVALEPARRDPDGFLELGGGGLLGIDEVQRVPELVRALKAAVDADRRPGRFLVTGSAELLDVPGVSDSLAGRAETVALYGLSQGELADRREDFVGNIVASGPEWIVSRTSTMDRAAYLDLLCAGGYPEAIGRQGRARDRWFENYLTRIVRRDAAEIGRLQHMDRLSTLIRLLAANNAGELVWAHLARAAGLPETSIPPYLRLLESLFLVRRIPSWSANLVQRHVERPKVALLDSGLAAHLIGQTSESLAAPAGLQYVGGLLEGFVAAELIRQRTWSDVRFNLSHFRSRDGSEVDLIVEAANGDIVGVEVKAAKSVRGSDFRGLEFVRDRAGAAFRAGIILHMGERTHSFGDRLWSMPVAALWEP